MITLNTFGYTKIKFKGFNLGNLIWNDETIASEMDIRDQFIYGGLTEQQWNDRYGFVPADMTQMADSIVSNLIEHFDDCSTIQSIFTTHGVTGIKDGINAIYTAKGWDDDSGWLASNKPTGRDHLDWSDHVGKYQRTNYYWDDGRSTHIINVQSFLERYTHGGRSVYDWCIIGLVPSEITSEVSAIMHTEVVDDNGATVLFYNFLSDGFTQERLNIVMEGIYDAGDGAIVRAFKDVHGCSFHQHFSEAQLATFDAKKVPNAMLSSTVTFRRPQTRARTLADFKPSNATKAEFMATNNLTEAAYMFLFDSFLRHIVDGFTILEYIESDGTGAVTNHWNFMGNHAHNYINSFHLQDEINKFNALHPDAADDTASDATLTGSSPSNPPAGAVNNDGNAGATDQTDDSSGNSDAGSSSSGVPDTGSSNSNNANVGEAVNNINAPGNKTSKSKGVAPVLILGAVAAAYFVFSDK